MRWVVAKRRIMRSNLSASNPAARASSVVAIPSGLPLRRSGILFSMATLRQPASVTSMHHTFTIVWLGGDKVTDNWAHAPSSTAIALRITSLGAPSNGWGLTSSSVGMIGCDDLENSSSIVFAAFVISATS